VNAVFALDVDYKGSKKATITGWRPEYIFVDGVEEPTVNHKSSDRVRHEAQAQAATGKRLLREPPVHIAPLREQISVS
jgi:hypothetical protein